MKSCWDLIYSQTQEDSLLSQLLILFMDEAEIPIFSPQLKYSTEISSMEKSKTLHIHTYIMPPL